MAIERTAKSGEEKREEKRDIGEEKRDIVLFLALGEKENGESWSKAWFRNASRS
jgi:hypothetical protein